MIDRFAEVAHEDTSKEHARRAESNTLYLHASERHPHHTNEREHADSVRNRLRLMQLEEPVHALSHRRRAFYFGARACCVGLKILIK